MEKYNSMENSKQMEALFKELELPNLRKKGDQEEAKAVVLAMMDTSRSMGRWGKFMARSFFFWMTRFLRSKYETVEIEFITHQTEAKVVLEEDFFSKGGSGGTIYSTAYRKALELIEEKYDPARYNIYSIHLSDGYNCDKFIPDTARSLTLVNKLMEVSNMFGYGELNPYTLHSKLVKSYKSINNEKFRFYTLKEESDIYYAMKSFFRKETKSKVV